MNFNSRTAIFSQQYASETSGGWAPPGPARGVHSGPPGPLTHIKGAAGRERKGRGEDGPPHCTGTSTYGNTALLTSV